MIWLGCIRNDLETRLKWFRRRLDLPGKHLAEVVSEELGMVWIRLEWPGDKTIPVSTVMPEALLTITGTVKHVHHDLSYQEELFPHCRASRGFRTMVLLCSGQSTQSRKQGGREPGDEARQS